MYRKRDENRDLWNATKMNNFSPRRVNKRLYDDARLHEYAGGQTFLPLKYLKIY